MGMPVLLVVSSCLSLKQRRFANDFPILTLPPYTLASSKYSALDWQVKGIKAICHNYSKLAYELPAMIELCNYSHIPLCNLEEKDQINYITDVLYSRLITKSNSLTWYNEFNNMSVNSDFRMLIPSDFIKDEIIAPGLYLGYCVEININLLALNTIVLADELKNLDKEVSQLIEAKQGKRGSERVLGSEYQSECIDELTIAKHAFRYLSVLVQGWVQDII